jgi:hypothetical protein
VTWMRNRWRRIMRRLRFSTVALTTELFGIDISELSDVRTRVLRKPTSSSHRVFCSGAAERVPRVYSLNLFKIPRMGTHQRPP